MNICTLNKIAACGTDRLGANYTLTEDIAGAAGVMVRSAAMHDMELPTELLAIARAGAGVNNIPVDKCSETGIVVFNTPGANANAVKELVLAGLFLSCRKVLDGIAWAKTLKGEGSAVPKLVEKGKGAFVGPELAGKKLGVIGLGAIGILVANAAQALGMEVYGFDPFMSVDAAWKLSRSVKHAASREEIYQNCDFITVHVPLNDDTRGMLNKDTFAQMPDGVRIMNFSRAELVNIDDMKAALESGKVARYVVDFPTEDALDVEGIIAIPHLGASTPESEDNCAVMAADELKAYLEDGNIVNSVNYPTVNVPRSAAHRLCVLHRNVPSILTQVSAEVSGEGINIDSMANRSRKDFAYTILDIPTTPSADAIAKIKAIDGVIRVRCI
ncbi:MAG: 3-phosphoglycerate dehydrogenase [Ruminococcaceae bacterium]|nr:3-phosphoglycerate dehydrogenase [Oscillospiraceae bacterium]